MIISEFKSEAMLLSVKVTFDANYWGPIFAGSYNKTIINFLTMQYCDLSAFYDKTETFTITTLKGR